MKITEKLKEIWNKIFHKDPEMKALPEVTSSPLINDFYRHDGSSISITPVLDKTGNQVFEQVLNHRTIELQNIAKYTISSPELKQLTGSDINTILMDFDSSFLQNPDYCDYIINTLLAPERMSKIFNQYEGYAGGIKINESGDIEGKYIDKGIINGLNASRQENSARYQQQQAARDESYKNEMAQRAANHSVNYKTSHAEDLSEYDR